MTGVCLGYAPGLDLIGMALRTCLDSIRQQLTAVGVNATTQMDDVQVLIPEFISEAMVIIPHLPEKLGETRVVVAAAKAVILTLPDFALTEAEATFMADISVSKFRLTSSSWVGA